MFDDRTEDASLKRYSNSIGKKVLVVTHATHDTLVGNHGMPKQGIIPSGSGKKATCLLYAKLINDIDKASSNHRKQGSSAPELGRA